MSLPHLRVIITIHQVFNDAIIVLLFTSLVYHSQSQNNIIMNYFILKFFYQRTVVQIYKLFFELTNFFQKNVYFLNFCTLNRIRTCDPQLRRLLLYPTELSRQVVGKAQIAFPFHIHLTFLCTRLSMFVSHYKRITQLFLFLSKNCGANI